MNNDQRTVDIQDHSGAAIEEKDRIILRWLTEAGLHLDGEAKRELEDDPRRVDTGLLRNSITFALDGEAPAIGSYQADTGGGSGSYNGAAPKESGKSRALYVGTNVEYAKYVSEGTEHMTPNRFIRKAFEKNANQLKNKLEEALKNA